MNSFHFRRGWKCYASCPLNTILFTILTCAQRTRVRFTLLHAAFASVLFGFGLVRVRTWNINIYSAPEDIKYLAKKGGTLLWPKRSRANSVISMCEWPAQSTKPFYEKRREELPVVTIPSPALFPTSCMTNDRRQKGRRRIEGKCALCLIRKRIWICGCEQESRGENRSRSVQLLAVVGCWLLIFDDDEHSHLGRRNVSTDSY